MSISKKKKIQVKPVKVVNYNINAADCNVLTMMQYVRCLRNINNQSTAICRQIIHVDIEVEYYCNNMIYHHPTSAAYVFLQMQCSKSSMELVWKYGRLSSIPFLKSSIPFYSSIFHIEISVPFYFIPCPCCRFYIIIIIVVTFYPNGCSRFENPEAPDFEKIASSSSSFSALSLPNRFRFQPLSSKCFRFHKKLTASTSLA